MWPKLGEWIRQPSTWTTIVALLGALGVEFGADGVEVVGGLITGAMVIYNLVRKEK